METAGYEQDTMRLGNYNTDDDLEINLTPEIGQNTKKSAEKNGDLNSRQTKNGKIFEGGYKEVPILAPRSDSFELKNFGKNYSYSAYL